MKTCTECGEEKPRTEFYYGRSVCKVCTRAQARSTYAEQPQERHRNRRLNWCYGITLTQYTDLLSAQGGGCAICRSKTATASGGSFHVDHDHLTGKVRGLLCTCCNQGLGRFRENSALLRRAVEYLEGEHSIEAATEGRLHKSLRTTEELVASLKKLRVVTKSQDVDCSNH